MNKIPRSVHRYLYLIEKDEVLPEGFFSDAKIRREWEKTAQRVNIDEDRDKPWLWTGAYSTTNRRKPLPMCNIGKSSKSPKRFLYLTIRHPEDAEMLEIPVPDTPIVMRFRLIPKTENFWDVNPWNYTNYYRKLKTSPEEQEWAELALGIFQDPDHSDEDWKSYGYTDKDLREAREILDKGELELYYPNLSF